MPPLSSSSSSSGPVESLERDGLVWLVVVCAGFFFGFGWVCGPLGWYFAKKLRRQAEATHVATPDVVRFAHISGIITTIITWGAVVILLCVLGVVMLLTLSAAPGLAAHPEVILELLKQPPPATP